MAITGNDWRDEIYPPIADETVFQGELFRNYLLRHALRCCDKKGVQLSVAAFPQMPNVGGWTDGDRITINTANTMISTYPKTEWKVLGMIGTTAHECGHINYTDMEKRRMYARGIDQGILYPQMPVASNTQEESARTELLECLNRKEQRQLAVLKSTLLMLHNILEDIYIEARQCARYGGIVQRAIRFDSRWGTERAATIRQMQNAGVGELTLMENVILYYLRTGKINDWEKAGGKYQKVLEGCREMLEEAVKSFDPDSRFRAANQLLLILWPFVLPELNCEERQEERFPEYEGTVSGKTWEKATFQQPSEEEKEGMERAFKKIRSARKIAGTNAMAKELKKLWSTEAGGAAPCAKDGVAFDGKKAVFGKDSLILADIHQGHELYLKREEPDQQNRQDYEREKKKFWETVRRMVRSIRPLLENQEEGWERGLAMGKRIHQKGLARMDGRIFGRRNIPGALRPVAVTVLLDESGSMEYDGKIESARQTALILYHFCRSLRIPIRILGHSTKKWGMKPESIELYPYTAFEPGDPKEGERLMKIRSRECNRDGAAIAYAGQELERRPEEIRILIVVTDGCPYGENYQGEAAILDTQEKKRQLVRKGIRVIAAAIGDDREEIERIYGKGFLNISDVKRLPNALAALIGSHLERQG